MQNTDLMNEQAAIEDRMATQGAARYHRLAHEARESGEASRSRAVQVVIDTAIDRVEEAITDFVENANKGRAGPRHTSAVLLAEVPTELAAFVAVRIILDGFAHDRAMTDTAMRIGRSIETEQRAESFAKLYPEYFRAVEKDLNSRTGHANHRRAVVNHIIREKGDEWTEWTQPDLLRLGVKLMELVATSTGLIEFENVRRGRRTVMVVQATARFKDWLHSLDTQFALLDPEFLPCVVPPKDWTSFTSGGYHTEALAYPIRLVKTRTREHRAALEAADLTKVYSAVNAIQRTPWAINTKVLEVASALVEQGREVAGLPPLDDLPLPTRPVDIDTNEEARTAWRHAASRVYGENRTVTGRRVSVYKTLSLAKDFKDYEAIYFPHQLDFRGRVYPVPQVLNPQGADLAKGLLHFAEGDPMGSIEAREWFLIHGANCYGIDDVSFDERIDWVEENSDRIIASAENPLDDTWWTEADQPFPFLAWAFEYAVAVEDTEAGLIPTSRIPIAMDGSCNGIQHYSAMLRDPRGAEATNLTPSDRPQDLYKEVADEVMDTLGYIAQQEHDLNATYADAEQRKEWELAGRWGAFGVDREVTKRPVMVLPYGGTLNSCQKYVYSAVAARPEHGYDDTELRPAAHWLAGRVWESIGSVVVAARLAMGWLRDTTSVVSSEHMPLRWTTPIGFPVVQAYPQMSTTQVKTTLFGVRYAPALSTEVEGKLDRRRQSNGVAPNFVHSLDGSALMATVNLAVSRGVTKFAMVHDSYATSAAHTPTLARDLREAFVSMYEDNEVLEDFLREAVPAHLQDKVKSPPMVGGLDIKEVKVSPYFFA